MFKSISAFLVLSLICIHSSFSQSVKFGLKAGADMNKIEGVSFSDKFTFGYHAGVFAEIGKIKSKWSIQPEVYFSQASVDTGSHFSQIYEFKKIPNMKFGYINIPLLLNYKPNLFVAFQLGPQFGILIDNNVSLLQNGKDAFKNGVVSGVGGIQIYIAKIRVYGRYVVAISDMNAIDDKDSWKPQSVQLGIGLKF